MANNFISSNACVLYKFIERVGTEMLQILILILDVNATLGGRISIFQRVHDLLSDLHVRIYTYYRINSIFFLINDS